ncbi:hypothetical protein LTR86_008909 [Recurvomyces mirabilis]|nr:hypothetical protein LTR86_008909 [Recurvomyces mirabilis]
MSSPSAKALGIGASATDGDKSALPPTSHPPSARNSDSDDHGDKGHAKSRRKGTSSGQGSSIYSRYSVTSPSPPTLTEVRYSQGSTSLSSQDATHRVAELDSLGMQVVRETDDLTWSIAPAHSAPGLPSSSESTIVSARQDAKLGLHDPGLTAEKPSGDEMPHLGRACIRWSTQGRYASSQTPFGDEDKPAHLEEPSSQPQLPKGTPQIYDEAPLDPGQPEFPHEGLDGTAHKRIPLDFESQEAWPQLTVSQLDTLRRFRDRCSSQFHAPTDTQLESIATLEQLPLHVVRSFFQDIEGKYMSKSAIIPDQEPKDADESTSTETPDRVSKVQRFGDSTTVSGDGTTSLEVSKAVQEVRQWARAKFWQPCARSQMPNTCADLPFNCTSGCHYSTDKIDAWARHEMIWQPQNFWHCVICRAEENDPIILARKDKMSDHIRAMHGEVDRSQHFSLCKSSEIVAAVGFEVRCKFVDAVGRPCPVDFNSWEERIRHNIAHFRGQVPDGPWTLLPGRKKWFVDDEYDDEETSEYVEANTIRNVDTYLGGYVSSGGRGAYADNMTNLADCAPEDERIDDLSGLSLTMMAQSPFGDDAHAEFDRSDDVDDFITADSDLGSRQYDTIGEHAVSGLQSCLAASNVPNDMHGERDDKTSANGGATTAADSGYHSQDQACGPGDCDTHSTADSILTDGRANDIRGDLKTDLVLHFARHLAIKLGARPHPHTTPDEASSLVRSFALLLEERAQSKMETAACTFIRHQRIPIARQVCRLMEEDDDHMQPSSVPQADVQDWLSGGSGDADALAEPPQDIMEDSDDDEVDNELSFPLEIEQAMDFAIEGVEFNWLLDEINIAADMLATGSTMSDVRATLLQRVNQQNEASLQVGVDWCPLMFLKAQYSIEHLPSFRDCIAYCGSGEHVEAMTCGTYLNRIWHPAGEMLLDKLDATVRMELSRGSGKDFATAAGAEQISL